jgi:hypothetical protein
MLNPNALSRWHAVRAAWVFLVVFILVNLGLVEEDHGGVRADGFGWLASRHL